MLLQFLARGEVRGRKEAPTGRASQFTDRQNQKFKAVVKLSFPSVSGHHVYDIFLDFCKKSR